MMASYRGADDAERRSKAQATKKTAIEQQQQRATRSKQQQAQSIIMATSSRELGRSDGPKGILREERERGSEYANPPFVAAREDEASPSQRSGNNNHLYDTSGKNNHENNRTEQSRYISRAKRDLDAAASEQTTSLASQLSQANSSGSVLPPGAASGSASASGNNRFGVLNSDTATQANKVDRNRVMPPFPALSPGQESSASSSQHSSRNAPTSAASGATPVSPHGVMGTPPGGPMASPLSSAHGSPAPLVPPSNKSGRRGNNKKDTGTPRGVPHVYHDFAAVSDTTEFVRKKTGGVTQPFPEKLHELLEKETTPDFHENVNAIVGWLPHGRAFLVRKPKEFTRDIMPK